MNWLVLATAIFTSNGCVYCGMPAETAVGLGNEAETTKYGMYQQQQQQQQQQQRRTKIEGVEMSKPGLHDLVLKTMHNTANYLGFGRVCRNNGKRTEDNTCICPKFYKGDECEIKVCINGGVLEKMSKISRNHCKCQYPRYIHGEHCEKPTCSGWGKLRMHSNDTWSCECASNLFYKGRFCEEFVIPTEAILLLSFSVVSLIVICICRMNLCKKSSQYYEEERRERRSRQARQAQLSVPSRTRRTRSCPRQCTEENLINASEQVLQRPQTAYPQGVVQPYVLRLDTIPTFNPSMIGGVDPQLNNRSQIEPPPPYERAVAESRARPPEYTPIDMSNAKLDE